MTARVVGIVLGVVGMAAARAQTTPAPSYPTKFEVASVRMLEKPAEPSSTSPISKVGSLLFTAHSVSLRFLVQYAFGVQTDRIEGGPSWMESTFYDVSARPDAEKGPTYEQLKPMLQQLLAQRFHLRTHMEEKEMKGYSLAVAKGGPRLTPIKSELTGGFYILPNGVQAPGINLEGLAMILGSRLKQPVKNDTGIQGKFDVKLNFAPPETDVADSSLPSIFTAVQEQLGLKLEPAKVMVQVLVIDHVDSEPTEN